MTAVRIPKPQGQAAALNTRLSVRLVTADGQPVLAFKGFDLLGDYADLALTADLTLELTPTAQLALPDGAATYYQFILRTPGRVERYQVQVPESPASVELAELVAVSAIPSAEILAEILAPYLVAREEVKAAAAAAAEDAQATAGDRVQTGLDAQATAADRVQTGLDVIATAADRVQTGLDVIATAGDRVQTGLDAQATAADRVQTGLDVIATAGSAQTATEAANAAAASYDSFDDRYLGALASEPLTDPDGDPLLAGALYFNTSLGELRVYDGAVWQAAYLPDTGWKPLILPAASLLVDTTIAAGNLVLSPGEPDLPVGVTVTVEPAACWLILGTAPRGLEYDPVTGVWDSVDLRAPQTLAGLADVTSPYPHDRELLEYDGAAAQWVPHAPRAIAQRLRPAALTQDLTQPADTLTLAVDGEALPPGRVVSLAPGACLSVASGGKTLLQYDAAQDDFEAVGGVLGAAVGTHGAQTLRDKTLIAPVLTRPSLERPVMTDVAVTGGVLTEVSAVFGFALMHGQVVSGTQQIPAGANALSLMPISLPATSVVEVGPQSVWTLLWPETTASAFTL